MKTFIVCAVVLGVASCGAPLGPDRGDPAQYLLSASTRFLCNGWSPSAPAQELGLFDVYFSSGGEAHSGLPATDQSIRQVVAAGGTVVRRFQVNGVRAILPIARVPQVPAEVLFSVTDLRIVEHKIDLGFTVQGKGGLILAQGGRITWMSSTVPDFFAIVPDAGIAVLRRDPDLRFLELNLPFCGF